MKAFVKPDNEPSRDLDIKQYWGCPCCDLLVKKQTISYHHKARCPRCQVVLKQPVRATVEKTLALSLGSLFVFFPAIYLPLLSLNLLGFSQEQSIMQSVMVLFENGYFLISLVLLMTCVVIPFVKILLLFYVSLALYLQYAFPFLTGAFKLYHEIDEWGMLEIYLLAILVSIIKLEALAHLEFNLGLAVFLLLFIMVLLSSVFLDSDAYWYKLEKLSKKNEVQNTNRSKC